MNVFAVTTASAAHNSSSFQEIQDALLGYIRCYQGPVDHWRTFLTPVLQNFKEGTCPKTMIGWNKQRLDSIQTDSNMCGCKRMSNTRVI